MDWKKYIILLPPFLLLAIFLYIYLPANNAFYAIASTLLFWVCYYAWVYIDKIKSKE